MYLINPILRTKQNKTTLKEILKVVFILSIKMVPLTRIELVTKPYHGFVIPFN